jgi:hypothetical protein
MDLEPRLTPLVTGYNLINFIQVNNKGAETHE